MMNPNHNIAYLELVNGAVFPEGIHEVILTNAFADIGKVEGWAGLEDVRTILGTSLTE